MSRGKRAEKMAEIMRDLGMEQVSYQDGSPYPSEEELFNPDLSQDEIAKLRVKLCREYRAYLDLESLLYPSDLSAKVHLNYMKLIYRMRKAGYSMPTKAA